MARSRTSPVVGLDIGTRGLRGAQLTKTGSSWRIDRLASVELPPGVILNGSVVEPKVLTEALRRLWRTGRFSTRRVRFGINNSVIMTRKVDLPWMASEDFRRALRYQLGDVLPVDLSTVQVDHHTLDEIEGLDDHGNVMTLNRVLVVAVDTDVVSSLAASIRKARLEPVAADGNAFALVRAAVGGALQPATGPEGAIDIGAEQVTVTVHVGGAPVFVRTVANVGGDIVTARLSAALGLSLDEAEEVKRLTGLNGPATVLAPVAESTVFGGLANAESPTINPRVAAALEILNSWASALIGEIRNSLEYFRAAEGGTPVKALRLAGKTTLLEGLVDRMRTQLRVPVTLLDPLLGLDASRRVLSDPPVDGRYAIAVGLAMADTP